ncbi:acyl-CoA carboxylase subunit beta [Sphingomonas sp. CL5.1]|uniref:acyl-CoA carboxylase subunit beta n=1 Tax=Sphingomonas sp. CL5.1 TaxID=2653203 RepID=UPI0020C6009F|nr:carboxyl transferase domain-containing protein [Sphingomonas sp. CL5.1]
MGNWDAILGELQRKRDFATAMGGPERLDRHRRAGKLNARERAAALFDEGNFVELGAFAGNLSEGGEASAPADGLIAGFGRIDGGPVLAGIEDFTVLAGSIGDAGSAKRYRLAQLARQERVPLVFMLEGAGHRLTNEHSTPAPGDLQALVELSGLVPMVCLVMGPSAGHGALTAPLSDFVVMTEAASLFAAGPPIVKAALGETATKEELGGPAVHVKASGLAHNLVTDDSAAIAMARSYLSYFPRNAWEGSSRTEGPDMQPRMLDGILDLIHPDPRIPFDARVLLRMLADEGAVLEVQPDFGGTLVTALARLGGRSVAIVANNPAVRAGAVDSAAAQKAAHFLEVADAFHLPVIFLADNPGVLPGTASERAGVLRSAARMFTVQHRLRTPKLHVTLRKAFGFGSSIMGMNPFDGQTLTLAFPAISLGAMPAASGAAAAGLGEAARARAIAEQTAGAWAMSDKMVYDAVIDPRELRNALLDGLSLVSARLDRPSEPRPGGVTP